jgi:hypothetical protein
VPIQKWGFSKPLRRYDHHHCAQDGQLNGVFSDTG